MSPQVFPFALDGRRMRVVALERDVVIEQFIGTDALGVERWGDVDLEAVDSYNRVDTTASEWVALAVLAVLGRGPV